MKTPFELFHIECGSGWKSLYEPLMERAKAENVEILQIKEKFGTLRFYVGSAFDDFFDAIQIAEHKSETTCELCGKAGTLFNDNGWYKTRCEEHKHENIQA